MTEVQVQWLMTAVALWLGGVWGAALFSAVRDGLGRGGRVPGARRRAAGALCGFLGAAGLALVWVFTPDTPRVLGPLGLGALLTQVAAGLTLWGMILAWRAAETVAPPPLPADPDPRNALDAPAGKNLP